MISQSIRWRLPLSYAAIALIAAIALGGVLLATLRDYYRERERDYLKTNASVIGSTIEQMRQDGVPTKFIVSSLQNYAFISRSRLRLLDTDYHVVGDTGRFPQRDIIVLSFAERQLDSTLVESAGVFTTFCNFEQLAAQDAIGDRLNSIVGECNAFQATKAFEISPLPPNAWRPADNAEIVPVFSVNADRWENRGYGNFMVTQTESLSPPTFTYPIQMARELYGKNIDPDESSGDFSDQVYRQTLRDFEGGVIGYLEMSEGPAYGRSVLASVSEAIISAGLIAVLLAATAGWFVSRNISRPVVALTLATGRMARGELAARVRPMKRRDELGILAAAFNEMAQRVETTISTLRRFVADAAHEINTPITALQTNLELAAGETTGESLAYIEQAQRQLMRLESLTKNLLNLARLEAPTTQLEHTPVDFARLITQIYEGNASRAEQADIMLDISVPIAPVIIQANESQMVCVVDNLLDNALKFTPAGGKVSVTLDVEGDSAVLIVKDTGIGIALDEIPRLFNRFHRACNAAAYPGNGLGLVITRTIVEAHHGEIRVASDSAGTSFSVKLPVILDGSAP